jgi:hypothetical protein
MRRLGGVEVSAHIADDSSDELAAERAVNERYLQEMRQLVDRQGGITTRAARTRNEVWVGTPVATPVARAVVEALYGRVALSVDDVLLSTGFYIGCWHQEWNGVQVVSWAAPVASLFYEGPASDDVLADDVVARRTFVRRGDDLVDFVDDIDRPGTVAPFTPTRASLAVPAAPSVARPRPAARPSAEPVPPLNETAERPKVPEEPTQPVAPALESTTLRAETAVLDAIERPRTGRLASVLATLQPDQYRLVTWSAQKPLVVQGQPGTGKTIVATHRAAYLVHPDREERLRRVAIVGPTRQYVEHVSAVIRELGVEGVEVRSLPELLLEVAGLHKEPSKHTGDERLDADWRLGTIIDRVVNRLGPNPTTGKRQRSAVAFFADTLANQPSTVADLLGRGEVRQWLERAGWDHARADWRFVPYLAAIGQAVNATEWQAIYDHVIVDEAQDVRPLEWRVLQNLAKSSRALSILGDRNQRRSDWTAPSWARLSTDLALDEHGGTVQEETLETAYRSTREILRFAAALLPKEERREGALRKGSYPQIVRVARDDLANEAVTVVLQLVERYRTGIAAVITMDTRPVSDRLRRKGWTRGSLPQSWTRDDRTVVVLAPADARGLEFDAVVVVEPSAFPQNVGRSGPLYTSLTRATKELAIVHSSALPKELRPRAK